MAFKRAQKITLSDLDAAAKEYEALLKKAETTYRKWDEGYYGRRSELRH